MEKSLASLNSATRRQVLEEALMAGALIIEGRSKMNAPVNTGYLRNSIQAQPGPGTSQSAEAIISVGADYGAAVEFGTSRQPAQSYLRTAIDTTESQVSSVIIDHIQDSIKKA